VLIFVLRATSRAREMTMPNADPRIDQYIAKAPAFARPILTEVRARVRQAVADVEETIKWNVPFFLHEGKLLASMAAFKKHAKVGVWGGDKPTMIDVVTVDELPASAVFRNDVKAAAKRIEGEGTAPKAAKKAAAKKPAAKKLAAKKAPAKSRKTTK
jgi:hypothetical protein